MILFLDELLRPIKIQSGNDCGVAVFNIVLGKLSNVFFAAVTGNSIRSEFFLDQCVAYILFVCKNISHMIDVPSFGLPPTPPSSGDLRRLSSCTNSSRLMPAR